MLKWLHFSPNIPVRTTMRLRGVSMAGSLALIFVTLAFLSISTGFHWIVLAWPVVGMMAMFWAMTFTQCPYCNGNPVVHIGLIPTSIRLDICPHCKNDLTKGFDKSRARHPSPQAR
jgi:hypothetical protein